MRSGTPAQPRLIWLKSRYPIGLHFEQPVGYWHSVTSNSHASTICSWCCAFHTREWQPFEPPASVRSKSRVARRLWRAGR